MIYLALIILVVSLIMIVVIYKVENKDNPGINIGIVDCSTKTVADIRCDLYNMFENVEEFESWLNDKED